MVRCAGINESYPERMVREYFEINGLISGQDFIKQYKIDSYFIDFYIPNINMGIEVDGEYWHNHTNEKEIKRENRIKEEIQLIRFKAKKVLNKEYERELNVIIIKIKEYKK